MKRKILLALCIVLVGIAAADDHHVGMKENRPDAKVFQWGDSRAGDCHLDGTLVIRPDGSASFDADVWTHTHGNDVWHSVITLHGPGGELGNSGSHDSPRMRHNHDGPGNKKHLHYDFHFDPSNFGRITEAVEHGSC